MQIVRFADIRSLIVSHNTQLYNGDMDMNQA